MPSIKFCIALKIKKVYVITRGIFQKNRDFHTMKMKVTVLAACACYERFELLSA